LPEQLPREQSRTGRNAHLHSFLRGPWGTLFPRETRQIRFLVMSSGNGRIEDIIRIGSASNHDGDLKVLPCCSASHNGRGRLSCFASACRSGPLRKPEVDKVRGS
jgi:hypothetical protein